MFALVIRRCEHQIFLLFNGNHFIVENTVLLIVCAVQCSGVLSLECVWRRSRLRLIFSSFFFCFQGIEAQ